jgi:hypothetical protein
VYNLPVRLDVDQVAFAVEVSAAGLHGGVIGLRFVEFLTSQEFLKLRARRGETFPGPVRNFGSAEALGVSAWKEEFDGCRSFHIMAV